MDWIDAILLGLVEGLTEYLPVSSTGHLVVTQRMLGIEQGPAANAFAICIQAGAIVAVLGIYRERVRRMWHGLFGRDAVGRRLLGCLAAAFAPAAVVGLVCADAIGDLLFGLEPIMWAWFVGGVAILVLMRGTRTRGGARLESLTWKTALLIGCAQCLALWPGVSRSLVTIAAASLLGLRLAAAVEFSFLLGVVTLAAATGYSGLRHGGVMLEQFGLLTLAVGFLAAALSAFVAVRWFLVALRSYGVAPFGWYRIGIAAGCALAL